MTYIPLLSNLLGSGNCLQVKYMGGTGKKQVSQSRIYIGYGTGKG
jgi:hypothetical protein